MKGSPPFECDRVGSEAGYHASGEGRAGVWLLGTGGCALCIQSHLPDLSPSGPASVKRRGVSWAWPPALQGDFPGHILHTAPEIWRRKSQLPGTGDNWALLKGSEKGAGEVCKKVSNFQVVKWQSCRRGSISLALEPHSGLQSLQRNSFLR